MGGHVRMAARVALVALASLAGAAAGAMPAALLMGGWLFAKKPSEMIGTMGVAVLLFVVAFPSVLAAGASGATLAGMAAAWLTRPRVRGPWSGPPAG